MRKISGDLNLMPLPDFLQWAETSKQSGSLSISFKGIEKTFYLQDGKMIFISSNKEGERLGEFFQATGRLEPSQIAHALQESKRLGKPFTGYLIENSLIKKETLQQSLQRFAESALADALSWEEGTFDFVDVIPSLISRGPIMLSISFVVFQSVKMFDETHRNRQPEVPTIGGVLRQLARQIAEGDIEIPPVPDIMIKLNDAMQKDDVSTHDVVRIIMGDQILTSKILRVVNSAFYSPSSEITSLQQAIIYAGFKTVMSIATVHTLEGISPKNAEEIREILRHSLLCSFVAKKIAIALQLDPEEAFVCGLLHDIGKTVILNLISDKQVPDEVRDELLQEYHPNVGFILGTKWKFSEVIRNTIKYHHNPAEAHEYRKMVEAIYVANVIANGNDVMGIVHNCSNIDFDKINEILKEIEKIKGAVVAII